MKLSERLQIIILSMVALVAVVAMIMSKRMSSSNIEVYNITNDVYVTAEEYVAEDEKININTANREQLMELEGIGKVISQRIIDYREQYGAFESIYEITNVNGISDKLFEKIEAYITT